MHIIAADRMEMSDHAAKLLGQITIPKGIRDHLHVKEGDRMLHVAPEWHGIDAGEEQVCDGDRGAAGQETREAIANRRSVPLMIRLDANALVWFLVRDEEEKLKHARTSVCREV